MDDGFCCLSDFFSVVFLDFKLYIWIAITHHSRTIHIFFFGQSESPIEFVPTSGDPSIPEMAYFELKADDQPSKPATAHLSFRQVIIAAVIILSLQRLSLGHESVSAWTPIC